jgi:hypothetical protein
LLDAMFTLFCRKPITVLLSSLSLLQEKAAFKAKIVRQVSLDPTTLHYNQPLLNQLCAEHAAGRDIYRTTTAANEKQTRGIADLCIVAGCLASRESVSLQRSAKLDAVQCQFSKRGFDYVDLLVAHGTV